MSVLRIFNLIDLRGSEECLADIRLVVRHGVIADLGDLVGAGRGPGPYLRVRPNRHMGGVIIREPDDFRWRGVGRMRRGNPEPFALVTGDSPGSDV